ncbi:MAG: hypothetical protein RIQ93_1269 [Verrucomicrobiota bacterium]|jgi:asparagine synthase (glutamine-hydrolysing)
MPCSSEFVIGAPTEAGQWLDPAIGLGLGMRRLSIVDVADGHQPRWNEDQTVGVVFNGEIYNYAELRVELAARGHVFATRSDTEVLVHLYEEVGAPAMFERLRGMFAFAIIDRPNRRLLLARDPFGMKPLYTSFQQSTLAFASEAKCLRELPGFNFTINPDTYLTYAAWLSLPSPETHWREVSKLRPGEWQLWNAHDVTLIARGCAAAPRFAGRGVLVQPAEAIRALDAALEDSVQRHLQADVPVGVLLSGGLDSLTIGNYAGRHSPTGLHTFTAGFTGGDSEFTAAADTARTLGSVHHEILIDGQAFGAALDRIVWHLDEPIGDPAAYALWQLCREAGAHVKVLLSGEGADELFAGYAGRYRGMVHTLDRSDTLRRWLRWSGTPGSDRTDTLSRWRARAQLTREQEMVGLRMEGVPVRAPHLLSLAQRRGLRRRQTEWAVQLDFAHADTLSACQQLDLAWQLPESLLMKADKMSMAASLELRCPFLDRTVAAVAMETRAALRLPKGAPLGKWILRETLGRHVPEREPRAKVGFPLPLGRWLRGPLREAAADRLLGSQSMAVQTFGRAPLERAWQAFVEQRTAGAHLFYALWLYEIWRENERSRL